MKMENEYSKTDKRVEELTGFKGALPRSKRACTSCGEDGHYYYECNGGAFLDACEDLALGLSLMQDNK